MSHEEERQCSSRVVVETPTARREEHYVQTRGCPMKAPATRPASSPPSR